MKALLLTTVLTLLTCTTAAASTVAVEGNRLVLGGGDLGSTYIVTTPVYAAGADVFELGGPTDVGAGCRRANQFGLLHCDRAGVTEISIELGDTAGGAWVGPELPATVIGGEGSNSVTLFGPGVVDGRGGNDWIYLVGHGDATVLGGDGIDSLRLGELAATRTTGTGFTADLPAHTIVRNQAGSVSRELTGVENVDGSSGADALRGDDGANEIDGGFGRDTIAAAGGDDRLRSFDALLVHDGHSPQTGYYEMRPDTVACGSGSDVLEADVRDSWTAACEQVSVYDVVWTEVWNRDDEKVRVKVASLVREVVNGQVAGEELTASDRASNRVRGHGGGDVIAGGRQADVLDGGAGDDVIDARGGGRDRVRCGPGLDRVKSGARDVVALDCETVS